MNRPDNFIDAETNSGETIWKHHNHNIWIYPKDVFFKNNTYGVYQYYTGPCMIHVDEDELEKIIVLLEIL